VAVLVFYFVVMKLLHFNPWKSTCLLCVWCRVCWKHLLHQIPRSGIISGLPSDRTTEQTTLGGRTEVKAPKNPHKLEDAGRFPPDEKKALQLHQGS
jgi:hypothetical protein